MGLVDLVLRGIDRLVAGGGSGLGGALPESVPARMTPLWERRRARGDGDKYGRLAKLHLTNVVVNACVRELTTSAAEPSLEAVDEAGEVRGPGTLVHGLLARPNRESSRYRFVQTAVLHKVVGGEAFVHKVRSAAGIVRELWLLRPDRVDVVPDDLGFVDHYDYKVSPTSAAERIETCDVIHWFSPSPLDDYRGISDLAASEEVGLLDSEVVSFLHDYFHNKAIPYAYIKTTEHLEPEKRRERLNTFVSQLMDRFGRFRGLGYLDANADLKIVGEGPKALDLGSVLGETETRICLALQIPPIVVGVKAGIDRSTYANYEAAVRSLWMETLSPLYADLGDALTAGLGHEFGAPLTIRFDLAGVRALQENQQERERRGLSLYNGELASRDEGRRMAGLSEMDGGRRVMKVNKLTVDLGAGVQEARGSATVVVPAPRRLSGGRREELARDDDDRAVDEALIAAAIAAARFEPGDVDLEELRQTLEDVARENGQAALVELGLDDEFEWTRELAEATEAARDDAVGFALNDQADKLGAALALALAEMREAVAIGRVVDEVQEVLSRAGEFWDRRENSRGAVGETEGVGAGNRGRSAAFVQMAIQRNGWWTQLDELVRATHAAQHGQTVVIGAPFANGLTYPGGPGPASERVNCRCFLVAEQAAAAKVAAAPEAAWEEFSRRVDSAAERIGDAFVALVVLQRERFAAVIEASRKATREA